MTPVPAPPPPGSITVPPWYGWEEIAAVLVLVLVAAVAAAVVLAAGRGVHGRSEWQAWLDGRSASAGARRGDSRPRPGTPARSPEMDSGVHHGGA
ncbi:MAG: hypothetical protein M3Q47_19775 [Actinomycetota bacterium]|nr:hypothetical protein [Actinomycetota bacterium]